jgi:hypothetical protein
MAEAAGNSYYVFPNGPTGDSISCTLSSPCSLTTGLKKAGTGDEVVLLDGVYTGRWTTGNPGVLIRAQNRHGAILRSPDGGILRVDDDNTTVRGLRIDGERKNVLVTVGNTSHSVSNIVIEDNIIENGSKSGMSVGGGTGATNIIIRHNLIQNTGYANYHGGSALYVGSYNAKTTKGKVSTLHVYGNTFRNFVFNGIDLKQNTQNATIHHNIFEEHVSPRHPGFSNEGTIAVKGTGHRIHDNIFRNIRDAGPGIWWAAEDGGNRIFNNVIMGVDKTTYAIALAGQRFGGAPTEITQNTFCNLPTYKSHKTGNTILIRDNFGLSSVVSESQCNAQITRILAERKNLPGSGTDFPVEQCKNC